MTDRATIQQPVERLTTLVAALALLCATTTRAAPLADLSSHSQQVRDAAAQTLRTTFVPWPRSRWEPLLASIKPGTPEELVLAAVRAVGGTTGWLLGSGQSFSQSYRLDDNWELICSYRMHPNEVFEARLLEHVHHVWVSPPADFTGTWTTYHVNGQRGREINYQAGRYDGVLTSFRSDGSVAVVQHCGPSGAEGEDTGYYPSGRLMYRGQYRAGVQVGTWTHYDEDGSVASTQSFTNESVP